MTKLERELLIKLAKLMVSLAFLKNVEHKEGHVLYELIKKVEIENDL